MNDLNTKTAEIATAPAYTAEQIKTLTEVCGCDAENLPPHNDDIVSELDRLKAAFWLQDSPDPHLANIGEHAVESGRLVVRDLIGDLNTRLTAA